MLFLKWSFWFSSALASGFLWGEGGGGKRQDLRAFLGPCDDILKHFPVYSTSTSGTEQIAEEISESS